MSGLRPFLVVGFGNELRGDDGLGPAVARALRENGSGRQARVEVVELPQLDISLVPRLATVELAVFVDARDDQRDDLVIRDRVLPSEAPQTPAFSSHTLGIGQLLRAALDWYGSAPDCYLIAPKGYEFSIGSRLSLRAADAARAAVTEVEALVRGRVRERGPEGEAS